MADKAKKAPTVEVMTREQFVDAVANNTGEFFVDREQQQKFFEHLGIVKMGDRDRLAIYSDDKQTILLKGIINKEGTLIFQESIDLSKMKAVGTESPTHSLVKEIDSKKLNFKPIKSHIHLPKQPNEEQMKKFSSDVTLFALSDKALNDPTFVSAFQTTLPTLQNHNGLSV